MVVGDNGVLNKAQDANKKTNKEKVREKVGIEVMGSYDETGMFQMDKLKENIKSHLGVKEGDITDNEDGGITFPLEGYTVTVDKDGKISIEGDGTKEPEPEPEPEPDLEITITKQPESVVIVKENGTSEVSFTVTVDEEVEGEFTYQWYYTTNGTNENGAKIEGATSKTYTISQEEVTEDKSGNSYYCEITLKKGTKVAQKVSEAALFTIKEANYSISSGGTKKYYYDLEKAIEGASSGNTIVVEKNVTDKSTAVISKTLTLNIDNRTVTRDSTLNISSEGILNIIGDGTITSSTDAITNEGKLIIGGSSYSWDVRIESTGSNSKAVYNKAGSEMTIRRGYIQGKGENGYGLYTESGSVSNLGDDTLHFAGDTTNFVSVRGDSYGVYKSGGVINFYTGGLYGKTSGANITKFDKLCEGCEVETSTSGEYHYMKLKYTSPIRVVKSGKTTYYSSLSEAYNAVSNGDTIEILKTLENINSSLSISKNITIANLWNGNGPSLKFADSMYLTINSGYTVTIKHVNIYGNTSYTIKNNGNLCIDSCEVHNTKIGGYYYCIDNYSKLTMESNARLYAGEIALRSRSGSSLETYYWNDFNGGWYARSEKKATYGYGMYLETSNITFNVLGGPDIRNYSSGYAIYYTASSTLRLGNMRIASSNFVDSPEVISLDNYAIYSTSGSIILNSGYLKSGKNYSGVVNKSISTENSSYNLVKKQESDGWKYTLERK